MEENIDSTSDQRTDPSFNVMRHEYRQLSEMEKQQIQMIKDQGLAFYAILNGCGNSREISLAKTKIEEAVMWGTKHCTR